MSRRIARCIAPLFVFIPLMSLFGGCGERVIIAEKVEVAPPAFASPDAEAPDAARGLTQYCPSDECPPGHTTCPLSAFRCDVDLWTDRNNCGACGVVCPKDAKGGTFECLDGACVMQCMQGVGDCDGLVDNGCETALSGDDNCGFCGNKCAPGVRCFSRSDGFDCGCPDGQVGCPEGNYLVCRDLSENDANCGACGNRCDPNPVVRNTYQGCTGGTCGWTRCINEWGNCDGDPDNGCEEHLSTNDNCNSCGNACAPGQECRYLSVGFTPPVLACTCSVGETFCPLSTLNGIPLGQCHDLSSSKIACGACGHPCASGEQCDFGVCRLECATGTADCNGSRIDQCEVNTNADPNNCGGCGIKCDGVAGQACVGGRCVVKPCDEVDAGGGPTR